MSEWMECRLIAESVGYAKCPSEFVDGRAFRVTTEREWSVSSGIDDNDER